LATAGKFAATTSNGVAALQGVTGFRGQLCHRNAKFDYAFRRMGGPVVVEGEAEPVTVISYESRFPYNSTTWAKLCSESDASDVVVERALGAIGAYADAIATITKVDFKGQDVKALGADLAVVANGLGASPASGIAKSLADPIASVTGAIAQSYSTKEIAVVVAKGDPGIKALLKGIDGYLAAVSDESKLVRHSLEDTLKRADKVLQPAGTTEYLDLAMRWTDDLDRIDDAISAARNSLKTLTDAQAKLNAAAGKDDAEQLKSVLGDLSMVLGDIEAIREAIYARGGK